MFLFMLGFLFGGVKVIKLEYLHQVMTVEPN